MAARIVPESDKRPDWPRLVHQFSKDANARLAALENGGGISRAKGRFVYG